MYAATATLFAQQAFSSCEVILMYLYAPPSLSLVLYGSFYSRLGSSSTFCFVYPLCMGLLYLVMIFLVHCHVIEATYLQTGVDYRDYQVNQY